MTAPALLDVRDLRVAFRTRHATVQAVDGATFALGTGEVLAVVGESGAGKSATALAVMGLLRPATATVAGTVRLGGRDLLAAPEDELRRVRGARIAMVFQDPGAALNPVHRIGAQIAEQLRAHRGLDARQARARAVELLERVRMPAARERTEAFPHELSGGMRQRAMLAMALSCDPAVLIADEPTAALDVTVQAQILDVLAELRDERGMGIVLVTHDLGVVAAVADRVAVMAAGRIVEEGPVEAIFDRPRHAGTQRLLVAARADAPPRRARRDATAVLLEASHLARHFPLRSDVLRRSRGVVRAVDDVTLRVHEGETLGLVGESGCGKTTLLRTLLRLLEPTAGTLRFRDTDITAAPERELRPLRRELQMVFQDPLAALNPRHRVGRILAAPFAVHGVGREEADRRGRALLERVGLESAHLARYPHELSGGQRQRIGIARALVLEPRVVVLDEPVSALDVSVRAQILALLADLQRDLGLSYLLVSHDLSVVRRVADRVAVMYLGRIAELGRTDEVMERPLHPYTEALLAAVPVPDPRRPRRRDRARVEGEPPLAAGLPPGCPFHPRCPRAQALCASEIPRLSAYVSGRLAACHFPLHVDAAEAAASTRSDDSPLAAGGTPPRILRAGPDSSAG